MYLLRRHANMAIMRVTRRSSTSNGSQDRPPGKTFEDNDIMTHSSTLLLLCAVALAGCQSDPLALPQPLPQVALPADEGPMPRKGKPRPEAAKKSYGLDEKFWRVTDDSQDSRYNCLGFAMCSQIFGYREPGDWPYTMDKVDRFFTNLTWTISQDCKPKKGVRKVVAYCIPGGNDRVDADDWVVHYAKQYSDDWWEGKMGCPDAVPGEPPRILYPGVGSINYQGGKPCRCYEMPLAKLVEYIKTKVFDEIERLRKGLGKSDAVIDRAEREAKERIKELEDAIKIEGSGL